jgi:putative ABC transport system ATP-binding protein
MGKGSGVELMEHFIEVKNLSKNYKMGEVTVHAIENMTFEVEKGEFVVILGPSGSGKSTLLNIIGGMDRPTDGQVEVAQARIDLMDDRELTEYRRNSIGFVFQFYNLIPNLTALENVTLVTELTDNALDPVQVLIQMGLGDKLYNFPSQLSGGEQQRVSIARALVKNPDLILCDEPTGALDYETGKQVLRALQDVNRNLGKTLVIITHNSAIGNMADKVIRVQSGHIAGIAINSAPMDTEEIEW